MIELRKSFERGENGKWDFRFTVDEQAPFMYDSKEEAEAALQVDIDAIFKPGMAYEEEVDPDDA